MSPEKPTGKESTGLPKVVFIALFIAVVSLSYTYFSKGEAFSTEMYGIKFVSDKPLEEYVSLVQSGGVALLSTQNKGGLTCGFELTAALSQNPAGYSINMEEGDRGVYLYERGGYVKGMSERELVTSCNAFACLAGGIDCPDDLSMLGRIYSSVSEINIVLENQTNPAAGRGYAELLGVLSYMQAEKLDVNKDGQVSQFELNNVSGNFLALRPFLMQDGMCYPQEVHSLYETFEPEANFSIECSRLFNTIFIMNSSVNKIVLDGSNVYLYGDDKHLYAESVILRDAMSPKWVRVLYQIER